MAQTLKIEGLEKTIEVESFYRMPGSLQIMADVSKIDNDPGALFQLVKRVLKICAKLSDAEVEQVAQAMSIAEAETLLKIASERDAPPFGPKETI